MMESIMEHGGGRQDNIVAPIVTVHPFAKEDPTNSDEAMKAVNPPVVMPAKLKTCPKTLHDF